MIVVMSTYSLTEAEIRLAELIDRALDGEGVIIARDDRALVELKAVARLPRSRQEPSLSDGKFALLRRLRALPESVRKTAAEEIRQMREEGEA